MSLSPKRSVLIADDDAIFRAVATKLVVSWGYDCKTAEDGEAALEILTRPDSPSIAILDWLMPNVTGTEVCRQVRQSGSSRYTYFMLVSARDGREDSLEALRSGVDAYVSKPLDREEFRAKLEIAGRIVSMEESLRDAHAETELFINSVPSILIGTDVAGKIGRWNKAAGAVLGVTKAAVTTQPDAEEFRAWWSESGVLQKILEVVQTGVTSHVDLPFHQAGSRRLIGLAIHPLRSHVGAIMGTVIMGSDITEKTILEDQVRQAQKLEAIGQLAAGIAHEINTPAQFVSDNVSFLKESWENLSRLLAFMQSHGVNGGAPGTEKTAAALREIVDQLDIGYTLAEVPRALEQTLEGLRRIKKIVRAMKEFSHPGSNQKQQNDINSAIQTTVTVSRNEWKYVADLETNLDPDLPRVPCVIDQINQVLLNVIVNAAHAIAAVVTDAASEKGRIRIRTRHEQNYVEISISDSGAGIPENIRARVFEPFFSTKQVGKGTGQGLALAHTIIVKEHGGHIWFHSEPGQGTTFFIRLPLTAAVDRAEAAAP